MTQYKIEQISFHLLTLYYENRWILYTLTIICIIGIRVIGESVPLDASEDVLLNTVNLWIGISSTYRYILCNYIVT